MKAKCLLLVGLVLLWPSTARADWLDIWGFLDQLSGPGPFRSTYFVNPEIRIPIGTFAPNKDQFIRILENNPGERQTFVTLRFSWLQTNDGQLRFLDSTSPNNTKSVHVFAIDPGLMYRAGEGVDVGVGATFMKFSGDGFDTFWHLGVIVPKVTLMPAAVFQRDPNRWARLVTVSMDGVLVQGFNGATDFNDPATKYNTSRHFEYLLRAGVQIDLELPITEAIKGLKGK
jgi:hypothetical protein